MQAGAREPQKPSEPKQKDDASRAAELKSPVPQDKELIEAPASQARQTVVNLPVESANQRSRTGAARKEWASQKSANRNSQGALAFKKEPAPRDKDGDNNDERAPALMRVLIVVEESAK